MVHAGAPRYTLGQRAAEELISAIRTVAAGSTSIDPHLTGGLDKSSTARTAVIEANHAHRDLSGRGGNPALAGLRPEHTEMATQLGMSVQSGEALRVEGVVKGEASGWQPHDWRITN